MISVSYHDVFSRALAFCGFTAHSEASYNKNWTLSDKYSVYNFVHECRVQVVETGKSYRDISMAKKIPEVIFPASADTVVSNVLEHVCEYQYWYGLVGMFLSVENGSAQMITQSFTVIKTNYDQMMKRLYLSTGPQ